MKDNESVIKKAKDLQSSIDERNNLLDRALSNGSNTKDIQALSREVEALTKQLDKVLGREETVESQPKSRNLIDRAKIMFRSSKRGGGLGM